MNCTREGNNINNNQHKNSKFFDNHINRNYQSDKTCHFNKFEKNNKINNYLNAQTSNNSAHAEIKNKKNNYSFEYHKSEYFHRNCSEKSK